MSNRQIPYRLRAAIMRQALAPGASVAQVAKLHGVHPDTIYRWLGPAAERVRYSWKPEPTTDAYVVIPPPKSPTGP